MRRGAARLFRNQENLYGALNLRRINWAFSSIAIFYGCDRTSVENQCEKYGIEPEGETVYSIESIASRTLKALPRAPEARWRVIDGERVNLGRRSYQDYLKSRG